MHCKSENSKTQPMYLHYQDELLNKILEIARQNNSKYEENYIVFVGDIVDRTMKGIPQVKLSLFLQELDSLCTKMYSVIGNHELSFKKQGNIFWNFAYGELIETSTKFELIKPIICCDRSFDVDDVHFKLWHYGQALYDWQPPQKEIVVVGHNNVRFDGMKEAYERMSYDMKEMYLKYHEFSEMFRDRENLKYVFLGHMHSLVGRFKISEEINNKIYEYFVENLGSLQRPKSNEYEITNLRNIPSVLIDGGIVKVVNNIITLPDSGVLNDHEVEIQHEKYLKGKYLKELRTCTYLVSDVVNELKVKYAYDYAKTELLNKALDGMQDTALDNVMTFMDSARVYCEDIQ